ncbi:DUF4307 domain-containing protein [Salinibacterium sp. G-O1]|uniref:DUF4307 domain-containing protein n=1 Tax=Salinibacterium sp. G-O1 TaxID=3046208 RepID=UPI0024B90BEE|nr:DUF4307 domain-containing protein [Salinibacterium sp. G-O1]MDJ0334426.1 DUF4307 domain-containing protein [Salinibacterium sp. G-O1]
MPKPETPAASSDPADAIAASLDDRYGRSRSATKRTRFVGVITASAITIVFVAWAIWGGLVGSPTAQFAAVDARHTVVSDSAVDVTWEFTAPTGTAARCAVQALNSTFAIVGWKEVELPASTEITRVFTERVLTTELAVTGLIYRCWLT